MCAGVRCVAIVVAVLAICCNPARAEVFVCAVDSIRVFADDAGPNDAPIRIITGPNTTISGCFDVALDIRHDEIYVADGAVKVFPAGTSGNVAPTRQIISDTYASSVAVDFQTNELFVGGPGPMLIKFNRAATGQATPLLSKTLTGADTPISLFVNRFHDEIALSGYVNGNVYFVDPATFDPTPHPTLGVTGARGVFASPTDDELFVGAPGGVQVYGWYTDLHRVISSAPTNAYGIGIATDSVLWAAFKGTNSGDPDQLISYRSTGTTEIFSEIKNVAPASSEARGIAVSRAVGCGAGHVECDSLFWDGFQFRRN